MRDTLQIDQAETLQQTTGDFAAVALEYTSDGAVRWSQLFETPTTGGVRSLALAARGEGVFFISDYGYPSSHAKQAQRATSFGLDPGLFAAGRFLLHRTIP